MRSRGAVRRAKVRSGSGACGRSPVPFVKSIIFFRKGYHANFPIAATDEVSYKHPVLIHHTPLAERLAILRAAPMPDASCGKLAAAIHALVAAILARLLDLLLLWQSGQLPSPQVRPAPQPRQCTTHARSHSRAVQPKICRRSHVRDTAPRSVSAAFAHPSAANSSDARKARPAPPLRSATGEARLQPAARGPPSNTVFPCRNALKGRSSILVHIITL